MRTNLLPYTDIQTKNLDYQPIIILVRLQQQNNFCNTWAEFYATQRIMPLMQLAFNQNKCTKEDVQLAEKLCNRFNNLFPEEKPSLNSWRFMGWKFYER